MKIIKVLDIVKSDLLFVNDHIFMHVNGLNASRTLSHLDSLLGNVIMPDSILPILYRFTDKLQTLNGNNKKVTKALLNDFINSVTIHLYTEALKTVDCKLEIQARFYGDVEYMSIIDNSNHALAMASVSECGQGFTIEVYNFEMDKNVLSLRNAIHEMIKGIDSGFKEFWNLDDSSDLEILLSEFDNLGSSGEVVVEYAADNDGLRRMTGDLMKVPQRTQERHQKMTIYTMVSSVGVDKETIDNYLCANLSRWVEWELDYNSFECNITITASGQDGSDVFARLEEDRERFLSEWVGAGYRLI